MDFKLDAKGACDDDMVPLAITSLLVEWFPFLPTLLKDDGYVFGGILREMWYSARCYDSRGSLSLQDTIRYHMYEYFRSGGGDLDIFISENVFEKTTGINLFYNHGREATFCYDQHVRKEFEFFKNNPLEIMEPQYELEKLVKRDHDLDDLDDEHVGYAYDRMRGIEDQMTIKFPIRHYKTTLKINPCPALGPELQISMDLITFVGDSKVAQLSNDHCDFGCNLLICSFSSSGSSGGDNGSGSASTKRPTLKLRCSFPNCASLEQFDQQVAKRKISILECNGGQCIKLIYRLSKRLESGWSLDLSDTTIGQPFLAKVLVYAITTTKTSYSEKSAFAKKQDETYHKFLDSKNLTLFQIFTACRDSVQKYLQDELETHRKLRTTYPELYLHKKGVEEHPSGYLGYSVYGAMLFLQDLCVRHDRFLEFSQWSKFIPQWVDYQSQQNGSILRTVIEHRPDLISKMYSCCSPFSTTYDVIHFLCNLMEFDRESHIHTFLGKMASGRRLVQIFNSRSDADKIKCPLLTGFIYSHISSLNERFNAKYLEILFKSGFRFPRIPYSIDISQQPLAALQFFWKHKLIDKLHLFPPPESYNRCIAPTGENLLWLRKGCVLKDPFKTPETPEITVDDVNRMAEQLHHLDFGFLFEFKKFCRARGVSYNFFERLFTQAFENGWEHVEQYFEYRFGTTRPTLGQVSQLPLKSERIYSYNPSYSIGKAAHVRNCSNPHAIGLSAFKKLVRLYGPHLFIGVLRRRRIGHHHDGYYRDEYPLEAISWLTVTYWIWRISRDEQHRFIWDLPNDVIEKIAKGI